MSRRARSLSLRPLATSLALLLAGIALLLVRPDPAAAAVSHVLGFRATVDGFTSWYGSYGMGDLGTAWCIDHGSHAPDPAFQYVPADLAAVPGEVQSAMAWAVATHGSGDDPVSHAALMLALHDLMGARYPSGRLDVDRLPVSRLAGFGGAEAEVLARARAIKADALGHRYLQGPLHLAVEIGTPDAAGDAAVSARVVDANGQGFAGVAISFEGSTAVLSAPAATTGDDGTATVTVHADGAPTAVQAAATVPHLPLDAWAPSTTRAQRVARPILDQLAATATVPGVTRPGRLLVRKVDVEAGAPLAGAELAVHHDADGDGTFEQPIVQVISTLDPIVLDGLAPGRYAITELTAPPGYDLLDEPVVVVVPPGGEVEVYVTNTSLPPPPTTTPPTTTPPITAPPPTAPPPTAAPPATVLSAPPMQPTRPPAASLPRTGADAVTLAFFGAGLVLLGRSLVELVRAQPSAPSARKVAMRSSS